jgi:hypothetical protein
MLASTVPTSSCGCGRASNSDPYGSIWAPSLGEPKELALRNLSNSLLHYYSEDQTAGRGHIDGEVFKQFFVGIYSVAQLEAQNLWARMDAKLAALGGIGNVPPA